MFEAEIWILNESPNLVAAGRVEVELNVSDQQTR